MSPLAMLTEYGGLDTATLVKVEATTRRLPSLVFATSRAVSVSARPFIETRKPP